MADMALSSELAPPMEAIRPGAGVGANGSAVPFGNRPGVRPHKELALLPRSIWMVSAVLIAWGLSTMNPLLTAGAIVVLLVCAQLLWRPGEPPVLLFVCAIQWVQASTAVFYANYYAMPLDLCFGGLWAESATWLCLVGVLALGLGMRVALLHPVRADPPKMTNIKSGSVFIFYLVSFAGAAVLDRVAWIIPGLAQFILAFIAIKWAILFLLFYSVLERRQGYWFMGIAFLIEVAAGVVGFFANFKTVFFLLSIALFTSSTRSWRKRIVLALAISAVLLLMGIVWAVIKGEYRDFLNQGTNTQQVLVPLSERADKLLAEAGDFSEEQFSEGIDAMVLRISYVKFFAMTLESVPNDMPYENGDLWLGALKHIATPRILFPDKAPLNDSEITQKYLGIAVAGAEQGTSIGIGYMAESYIDYGPFWMCLPIFGLGLFYGLIYRYFVVRSDSRVLGFAAAVALLLPAAQDFAASNVKILGGVVMAFIVIVIAFKLFKKLLPNFG